MEVSVDIDREYIKQLLKKTNANNTTQIASEAVALLSWAIDEILKGRQIVSLDEENESYQEVVSPLLENAKNNRESRVAV